jgi:hypothetical protein
MQSILDPKVIYKDLSRDIVEHDVDVVSDLWNMDGRDVYRGSRDRQYAHANVYWLYTEDLERVGLVEHSLENQSDFRILWFHDSPFATLLQEEGWTNEQSIWSVLSRSAVEMFLAEDWTSPSSLLNACLHGPTRILTVDMVLNRPSIYYCSVCGSKTMKKTECAEFQTQIDLDFPSQEKIIFIDDDLYVCSPPTNSKIWELLGFKSQSPLHDASMPLLEPEEQPVQQPVVQMETEQQTLAHLEPQPLEAQQQLVVTPLHLPQEHPPQLQTTEPLLPLTVPKLAHTKYAMSLQSPGQRRRYSG